MAFTIYLSTDYSHDYGDNDIYEFQSGPLIVEPADGTKRFTYNNWIYLEADADHQAGGPKGGKSR